MECLHIHTHKYRLLFQFKDEVNILVFIYDWWLNIMRTSWGKLPLNDYLSRSVIISGCDWLSASSSWRLHFPISGACQTDARMQRRAEGNLRSKPEPWVWKCIPALEESRFSFIQNNKKGNWPLQQGAVYLACATGNLSSMKHRQKSLECTRKLEEEK